jgi:hypothetical protein
VSVVSVCMDACMHVFPRAAVVAGVVEVVLASVPADASTLVVYFLLCVKRKRRWLYCSADKSKSAS